MLGTSKKRKTLSTMLPDNISRWRNNKKDLGKSATTIAANPSVDKIELSPSLPSLSYESGVSWKLSVPSESGDSSTNEL